MRKIILCFILLFMLSGCKEDYKICKVNLKNNIENYTLESEYKIYYKNSFVTKIEKEEVYKSTSKEKIKYLEEINKLVLNNYNSGYTYDIKKEDNKLIINTNIDTNTIDINQLIDSGQFDQNYIVSNKITLSGLVKYYESKGAACDI